MILASASPRRRELLEACGLEVRVRPADINETRLAGEDPRALVERLALAKAHAALGALDDLGDEALLAADTIVWDEAGDVLGKPRDDEDAARMLRTLSGHAHFVSTGVCLLLGDGRGGVAERSFVETTRVRFCELSEAEVTAYVASGEPRDKAGAYGIQGLGRFLVSGIEGDYTNVVGLPVNATLRALDALRAEQGRPGMLTRILEGDHGTGI